MKITLNQGQDIFFTSDTHINHKNICRGVSGWLDDHSKGHLRTRDFENLDKMNSEIIDNINRKVGQDDILVHLGDFSFGGHIHIPEFRQRIVCQNIIFVYGNHDEHIQKNTDNYQSLFSSVHHYLELEVSKPIHQIFGGPTKHNFVLCHFPIASHNNLRIFESTPIAGLSSKSFNEDFRFELVKISGNGGRANSVYGNGGLGSSYQTYPSYDEARQAAIEKALTLI